MPVIKAKIKQTIADIALQEYGDIEGVYWLVEDNDQLIGITDTLHEGDELIIRDAVINQQMVDYLRQYPQATGAKAQGEGIGYWKIEIDFKAS